MTENQTIATEILKNQGYSRDNYQGKEYRDGTGNLNDYMPASEQMFDEWIAKVLENWPAPLDKISKIAARKATINAIDYMWRKG